MAFPKILRLPDELRELYYDLLTALAPEALAMIKHEYQSEFARTYYTKGREEGRIEMVLELAAMKLGRLTPADETRIRAITDAALLRAIVTSLARAEDDADARVVFERMVPPPASENH